MAEKRKPPINIDELEGDAPETRSPGKLGYTEEKKPRRGPVITGGGKSNITHLLAATVAAVVISVFCTIQLAPGKGQLNEVVAGHNALVAQMGAIPPTVVAVSSRLDNVINSLAGYATKGETARFVTSDGITSLSTQITGMSTSVATATGDVAALRSELSTLETTLEDLRGKIVTLTTQLTADEATLTAQGARIEVLEASSPTTTSGGSSTSLGGVTITATPGQSPLFGLSGVYYYQLLISNSSSGWKKVQVQVLATPSTVIGITGLVDVTSADFVSSVSFSGGTAFTSTFSPTSTTVIVGTSNGYLIVGPGATPVVVTLTYTANTIYGWDMAFSPIVIP